ncbi:MAG TPA: PilZ domain-containing protein, partial [Candidatus Polarisedimenticolia bacterium]|nr:PilZ domain-containing protein [Candidatus Polarisedimenticolia bacterium]
MSVGVAGYPDEAESAETLIARADEALYRAKAKGKNQVAIYYREKRKADRVSLKSRDIRVMLEGDAGAEPAPARALNISEGGLLLETSRPLQLGQSLELRLLLDDDEISLAGQVVRLEPKAAVRRRKLYDAGVRFRLGRRSLPAGLSRLIRESVAAGV